MRQDRLTCSHHMPLPDHFYLVAETPRRNHKGHETADRLFGGAFSGAAGRPSRRLGSHLSFAHGPSLHERRENPVCRLRNRQSGFILKHSHPASFGNSDPAQAAFRLNSFARWHPAFCHLRGPRKRCLHRGFGKGSVHGLMQSAASTRLDQRHRMVPQTKSTRIFTQKGRAGTPLHAAGWHAASLIANQR